MMREMLFLGFGGAFRLEWRLEILERRGGRGMTTTTTTEGESSAARRKLMLHDGAAFLILTLVAVTLFGVTLFLFRSFEEHRAELAERWSSRAREELRGGRPEMAIAPLRTALSYAPDDRGYALLLAQALGDAGHTEEATNYFLNLWDARPGDGFINLELARLEARRRDPGAAINYYRAAVYGTWEGDGVVRRRDVRLELSRYLIEQHDLRAAQAELQVAAGNAPEDGGLEEMFGDRFQEAGDAVDAMTFYGKAIKDGPHSRSALAKAGALAYGMGDYTEARGLLARAVRESAGAKRGTDVGVAAELNRMYERADRIVELEAPSSLAGPARATRVLQSLEIARHRMEACMAGPGTAGGAVAPGLADLVTRWARHDERGRREALAHDEARQDGLLKLAYDTEVETSKVCGQPTGDDALLLRLAQAPAAAEGGMTPPGGR